jgi:hypothetical protein
MGTAQNDALLAEVMVDAATVTAARAYVTAHAPDACGLGDELAWNFGAA